MSENRLGLSESRFADIIWEHEPVKTTDLVAFCREEFAWKRTTTYTVLKRLCERGLFETKDSIVTALISREQFYATKSADFVRENFQGSLPAFLAAFTKKQSLTAKEIEQIQSMIDAYRQGKE